MLLGRAGCDPVTPYPTGGMPERLTFRGRVPGDEDTIARVLDGLGHRLAALRHERGIALSTLAEHTGISVSTLSRLESGARRPTLQLLLPLALVHGMTLDALLGFPGFDERRVHAAPRTHRSDVIVWPLTRSDISPEPFKIVYSQTEATPPNPLPTHVGWKWMYVLAGRLRVVLDDQDVVLEPGEVAEIDTRRPHWTGSTGEGPVEVLLLVGHDGTRIRSRVSAGHPSDAP